MNITSQPPKWGDNYDIGYCGFQYIDDNLLSEGIAYFERWERMSDIKVSHCFIVTGQWECVEALGRGVVSSPLGERFQNPHCAVFFRKPVGYTADLGQRIASAAKSKQGCGYDYTLIAGHAMADSWLVHRLLSKATEMSVKEFILSHSHVPNRFICSEFDAYCLDAQPELKDRGCLAEPEYWIEPQDLFEDNEVFEGWNDQAS